ncbi:MAG: AAA family ATPase, partial [Polyangiaceae bacterium]
MLLTLRIQDFVLIDEIELRLEPGYNVVTGETGAGKSILVGALNLVLGGRSRSDLVRPGAREAIIEALFDIHGDEALETRLQEAGIECGGELLIRRVVQKNGRSRAYMNGRMCTISELSALALSLADVTSQHESVALNDPSRHIDYLDRYAGLTKERESLAHVVDELNETLHALRALAQREKSRGEREDFLRFQLDQIDTLDPQPGELEALEGQRQRLQHARRLGDLTGGVLRTLDGQVSWSGADGGDNDDPSGGPDPLCDRLARLNADLGAAAELDSSLSPVAEELEDCWARLRDVASELAAYSGQLQSDPDALEQVQERLFALQDLMRKHGPTLNEVLSVREQLSEELSALDHGDEQRRDLDTSREKLARVATDRARKLSRKRRRAARNLGKAITTQLQNLGMGSARVLVEVSPTPTHGGPTSHRAEPSLVVDGGHLGRYGLDRVELLIAPNKGLDPR